MKATVVCDICGWKLDDQNVEDWHNKLCPACLSSIIVNDDDMKIVRLIKIWKIISFVITPVMWLTGKKKHRFRVNTAALKDNNTKLITRID